MSGLEPQKRADLFIIRGDSLNIPFTVNMDITGATVFFTAKAALDNDVADTSAVISVEVTSHDDPANGSTTIPLSTSDTNVTPGEYFYDIQIKIGSEITSIPVRKLIVYADVTRRTA